jgi:hypothetical protein
MQFFRNRISRRPTCRRPASCRPTVEVLESRDLLSGYTLGPLVQVSGPSLYAGSTADNLPPQDILLNSEDENQIAVDPTNANHLVALWQGDETTVGNRGQNVGVSFDGGQTWKVSPLPGVSQVSGGPLQSTFDPWLAFAPNGDLYATCLAQQFQGASGVGVTVEDNVLVLKSTDGGLTWGTPTVLHDNTDARAFNDKESITTDPSDPRFAYMAWDFFSVPSGFATRNEQPVFGFTGFKAPALFTRTTDGGQTWEPVQTLYDPGSNAQTGGHQIIVRPDGTLLDFFAEGLVNKNNDGGAKLENNLSLVMSNDRGQTWQNGKPIRAAKMFPVNLSDPDNGIPIDNTGVAAELPDVTVDPHNGYLLYAVWRDGRFSGGQYSSIAFSMSSDGGLTWSAPIKVNQTPTTIPAGDQQAWLPSVKVAADGTVAVTYYDFRNNNAKPGLPTDYWVVFGRPTTPTALTDPDNWGNELRLTDRSFDLEKALFPGEGDPTPGLFLGDYEGLKVVGNDFVATFCVAGVSSTDPKSVFFRRIIAGDPLEAASLGHNGAAATLTSSQVDSILPEAIHRWEVAGVDTSGLGNIQIQIAELGGSTFGLANEASHTIWLDAKAAGWGWFVDPTPANDSEFTTPGNQGEQSRMDLLTVLDHELGHVLGFEHQRAGVMEEYLTPGTRRVPAPGTTTDAGSDGVPAALQWDIVGQELAFAMWEAEHPWGKKR